MGARALPIRSILLAFAAGVWLLQQQASLPRWPWLQVFFAVVAIAMLSAWFIQRARSRALRYIFVFLAMSASAALGFSWAGWRAETRLADELPIEWEGKDVQIVGVVDDLPRPSHDGSVRFFFAVERIVTPEARVPTRLSLTWYASWYKGLRTDDVPALRAGERWQLSVRLKRPHGNANPHGFDYEAWLLENNLRATGYVRKSDANQRIDPFAGRFRDYVQRTRERARERITAVLEGKPYAGVIVALAIGDQRAIPAAQWQLFNRTGIGHLISISGLHVTFYATAIAALCYWLWRRSHRLTLSIPARKAAALLGAIAATLYVLLAGFSVPAQRTLYMLIVAACGLWWGRPGSATLVLVWALAVVLLLDPWAVVAPGFWLSFSAVWLLLYVSLHRLKPQHWLLLATRAQFAVTLGLLPLMLALFQQVSLVSPIANAFAIPIVSFVIVPVTLLSLVLPWDALLSDAHALFAVCARALEWLASLPSALWEQHAPPPWAVACGVLGAVLLLAPRGFPAKWLGFVGLLPLFVARPDVLPHGAVRLIVLDVGQGLAVVAQSRAHALLYDTGARWTPDADAGSRVIVPFLRGEGIRHLTGLVVSHADVDHAGGASSLLQAVPIEWMLSSLPMDNEIVQQRRLEQGAHIPCYAGQYWEWGEVRFEVLHPLLESYDKPKLKTNDQTCVLKIIVADKSVLLTGDIEARSELELLRRDRGSLRADVLLVPHHGSKTSSIEPFIAAVQPDVAIVAAGYRNRFGHPRAEVVARYREAKAKIYRTDFDGALELLLIPNQPLVVRTYRSTYRRYWREMPQRQVQAPLE